MLAEPASSVLAPSALLLPSSIIEIERDSHLSSYRPDQMIDDNSEEEGRRYCQLRLGDASASPLPRFHYEPLEPRCIRVLELQPGQRSDPFQGRFIVTNVDSDLEYDALSYMWGDATQADQVVVDGAAIPTAWNLTRALEYLRDFRGAEPLRIWIDAICVDQDSLDERAEQVAMMRSVYRNAHCVRIWINEPFLDEQSAAVAALKSFRTNPDAENDGLGNDIHFWDPLIPIFQNGYWTRIWIKQEILNAQYFMLHCMNVTFDCMAVAHFQSTIYHMLVGSSGIHLDPELDYILFKLNGDQNCPIVTEMFAIRGEHRKQWDIATLLRSSVWLQASRGHDRLYALMHLAKGYEDGSIIVDYNKTVEQVMTDAAAYYISQHQDLDFLIDSFQDDVSAGDQPEQEETVCLTCMPQAWMGRSSRGSSVNRPVGDPAAAMHQGLTRTKCSPHSIDTRNLLLHVRGVKVGQVRQTFCFNEGLDNITVAEFWASPFGIHIQSLLGSTGMGLPLELSHTICGGLWHSKYDPECVLTGLAYLFEISKRPEYTGRPLHPKHWPLSDSLGPLEHANVAALREVMWVLNGRACIITNNENYGLVPTCNIQVGDEIWLVLGSFLPIVLRRQPSGRYWHICLAFVPALDEHQDLAQFSSDIQPGDKVGEWTVEDVELV